MKIALTGATGIVGSFVAPALAAAGHDVDPLAGFRLGDAPDLSGCDALVHLALAHDKGRYRGGEGADPAAFMRANLDGTLRLFQAAASTGVGRIVFLSSRAVHDGHPPGTVLTDDLAPAPTTLYGQVKAQAEAALAALPVTGTSLRATGVYGPGLGHKWRDLFSHYLAGHPTQPRVATEVHGADLAAAILIALTTHDMPRTLNVSDLVLDRRDLLARVAALTGCEHPLPDRADASTLKVPDCAGLMALGWQPGGKDRLARDLPLMLDQTPRI